MKKTKKRLVKDTSEMNKGVGFVMRNREYIGWLVFWILTAIAIFSFMLYLSTADLAKNDWCEQHNMTKDFLNSTRCWHKSCTVYENGYKDCNDFDEYDIPVVRVENVT